MKKTILVFFLAASCLIGTAQSNYFYHAHKSGERYFIAADYGAGTAHWNSLFKNTEFYDKDGAVIHKGNFKFSSNSPTRIYDLNVLAPIGHIRVGMGIAFEFHYLAQLKIYSKGGEEFLLFNEGMRFDKVYLQTEVPFKFDTDKKYSFSWIMKAGWFGYTNVKRFNFLGEKPFPISFLAATGITADYEVYPQVFVFAQPNLEYKLYDNYNNEAAINVRHSIFSMCMLAGIRVDLGKLHN